MGSCAPKRWTEMTAKMEVTMTRMMKVDDTGTSAASEKGKDGI